MSGRDAAAGSTPGKSGWVAGRVAGVVAAAARRRGAKAGANDEGAKAGRGGAGHNLWDLDGAKEEALKQVG